jgi:phosphate transport system substrate-binding protein
LSDRSNFVKTVKPTGRAGWVTQGGSIVALAAAGTLALSGCGTDNNSSNVNAAPTTGSSASATANPSAVTCASGSISGQGSTFQQNIEQQWVGDYHSKCSGAQVNYEGTGSGAGISQFGSGTADFAGSDVTMKPDEQQKANSRCGGTALTVPITAGGIAIIYHLSGVSSLNLSAGTLAGIFDGSISKWNDPKIAADNPGAKLPGTAIAAFHRSDGSGTTSVFTDFLSKTAGSVWTLGSGKTVNWPSGSGQAAKGSDGVTAGVKSTDGGITYAEASFATANNLPTAKVKGSSGDFAELTGANVSKAIDSGFTVTGTGNDLSGKLDFTKMQGYPVSTVSYAIVCAKYADAAKGKLVSDYFQYAVTTGQSAAQQLSFAPLPTALADKAKSAFASVAS